MAIRNIRIEGDAVLRKTCRDVKEITPKIEELIEDMLETMYEAKRKARILVSGSCV